MKAQPLPNESVLDMHEEDEEKPREIIREERPRGIVQNQRYQDHGNIPEEGDSFRERQCVPGKDPYDINQGN